jgi:hypothetical protein
VVDLIRFTRCPVPGARRGGGIAKKDVSGEEERVIPMNSRRGLVTLPDGVWETIDMELKGKLGDEDGEVIRNIVIAYLSEKGYLVRPKVSDPNVGELSAGQIASKLEEHDTMFEAFAEELEETGIIKYAEWQGRVKKKLAEQEEAVEDRGP